MKTILSIILMIISGILAIYVGGWLMFIMPIVDIINTIKNGVDAMIIGISIFKMLFASFVAWLILVIGLSISKHLLD